MSVQLRIVSAIFLLCQQLAIHGPVFASAPPVLAPGSQIRLLSEDEPSLNIIADVDWDGDVQIPLCGRIKLKGFELPAAEEALRGCLRRFYKKLPQVRIHEILPRNVLVKLGLRGESSRLTRVPVNMSVQSLMAREGIALTQEQTIRLLSPYGMDLVASSVDVQWGRSFAWRGGEILIVEKNEEKRNPESIDVLGEVRKPGKLSYQPAKTVLDVIRDVQGPTPQAAADSVIIYRTLNGQKIETHWADTHEKIQPGDVLFVPSQKESTLDKGLRWTVSFLSIVNTLFLIRLSSR